MFSSSVNIDNQHSNVFLVASSRSLDKLKNVISANTQIRVIQAFFFLPLNIEIYVHGACQSEIFPLKFHHTQESPSRGKAKSRAKARLQVYMSRFGCCLIVNLLAIQN